MPEAPRTHRCTQVVGEGPFGLAHYTDLFAAARVVYFRECGFDYSAWSEREKSVLSPVEIQVKLVAGARAKDTLTVETFVVSATSASVRFGHRLFRRSRLLVEAEIRVVCTQGDGDQVLRMPERMLRLCVPPGTPGGARVGEASVELADDITRDRTLVE